MVAGGSAQLGRRARSGGPERQTEDPELQSSVAITGHSPEVMLRHYRGVTEEDKRRAAENACLGAIPEGRLLPLARPVEVA